MYTLYIAIIKVTGVERAAASYKKIFMFHIQKASLTTLKEIPKSF